VQQQQFLKLHHISAPIDFVVFSFCYFVIPLSNVCVRAPLYFLFYAAAIYLYTDAAAAAAAPLSSMCM